MISVLNCTGEASDNATRGNVDVRGESLGGYQSWRKRNRTKGDGIVACRRSAGSGVDRQECHEFELMRMRDEVIVRKIEVA